MLRTRILTAVIAALLLFVVLFAIPVEVARVVIAAVVLTAAWEWGGFVGDGSPALRTGYVALTGAALAATYFGLQQGWLAPGTVFIAALAWWAAALAWIFFYPTPVPRALPWLGGLLVLVPAWLALDRVLGASPQLLLFMLIVIWAADIGAYFAGRRFGRVKLAPAVSPGKTWEGVLGGLVAVALLGVAGAQWFGLGVATLLPFCLSVALISIVGDLTVSMFKRSAGVKDSGKLFPGHGGLLDRMDSIAAAAPLFALGMSAAGLA